MGELKVKENNYGVKIGKAYKAIIQMHDDIKKLLMDCDNYFNLDVIFDNTVTSGFSYSIRNPVWLAPGVFRYWLLEDSEVFGITIVLHSTEYEIKEPLLILGILDYNKDDVAEIKDVCNHWDLWNSVLDGTDEFSIGEVKEIDNVTDDGRINNINYYVKPLFELNSFNDVKNCIEKLI